MKFSRLSLAVLGATVLSSVALAGETNKATLHFDQKISVEGKQLNPGNYSVEWEGSGPQVQVTIHQGKQTVATFPAHLTEQAKPNSASAYGSSTEPDGTQSLIAIYVGGKKTVLEIDHQQARQ